MKAIIVHGGAGQARDPSEVPKRVDFMKDVATTGYELLRSSHNALETAVEVVKNARGLFRAHMKDGMDEVMADF